MAKPFLGGRIVLGTEFSGYKIGLFEAGTSTQKTTYTDSSLTAGNENTHPVVLDANGAAQIYFDGNAKAILYTGADVVVYTDDNINLESTSSATGADNLILNNSFEDDTDGDGIPDNWTRTLYTGGAFTLDTTTQSHGSKAAKFTSTGTGGGYLTSTATYAIRPSTSYSVGVNLKSSDAGVRNVVEVLWYKADGTASSTASTTLLDDSTTNPTGWTENWYETSSPSDAYFAKIRLTGCHSSDATAGSTHFDDVNFTAGVLRRAKTTFTNTVTMSAKSMYWAKGADIVSAATLVLGDDGNMFDVTGSTGPITAITVPAGMLFMLQFDSTPTLTHGANLRLPNATSITAVAGMKLIGFATAANSVEVLSCTPRPGEILQVVNTQTGAVATGSTAIPADDTIPQNTEGDQYMTLAITPKLSTSKLLIEVHAEISNSAICRNALALFQDTTVDALAAVSEYLSTATALHPIVLRHYMTSGTVSATTFKVRIGPESGGGTVTFNGQSAGRIFGGVAASSITITEIAA